MDIKNIKAQIALKVQSQKQWTYLRDLGLPDAAEMQRHRNFCQEQINRLTDDLRELSAQLAPSPSLKALHKAYKGVCVYCAEKVTIEDADLMHVEPKSKRTNDDVNLVVVHKKCNRK